MRNTVRKSVYPALFAMFILASVIAAACGVQDPEPQETALDTSGAQDSDPQQTVPDTDYDSEIQSGDSTSSSNRGLDEDTSGSDNIPEAVQQFPPTEGSLAPLFTLPSVSHGQISLTDFSSDKPVVLVFYRAYWCSACRRQLDEINRHYSKVKDAGAEVIAVSTDDLSNARNLAESRGYKFPIAYTAGSSEVPGSYDRFNKFGDGLASASIFIVDTDGVIAWEELGRDPYHFVRASQIVEELNSVHVQDPEPQETALDTSGAQDSDPQQTVPDTDYDSEIQSGDSTSSSNRGLDVDTSGSDNIPEAVQQFPPTEGSLAPLFTLPSVSHGQISLTDFSSDKPVVLVFYRAYWCSACRRQLDEINRHYSKVKDAGAEVIAVSTDDLSNARNLAESRGYKFPIAYTAGSSEVPGSYDRFNKFGDGLASASIFIIDTNGVIAWEELGRGPYHFVRASQIVEELNSVHS